MADKIIGYSYFGRSRGLQTVNGGGLPPEFPVNDIVDLDPKVFDILPGERLYRISRILQKEKLLHFISLYEYAKEKDSDRSGTFMGATIALYDCIAPAEHINSCLIGMVEYLNKYLNNDEERRFIISELSNLELKEPKDFITLSNVSKEIKFKVEKLSGQEVLVSLSKSKEFLDANAFIHHALNDGKLYRHGELYATSNTSIVQKATKLHPLKIDLHFESEIGARLLEIKNQESELTKILTSIKTEQGKLEEIKTEELTFLEKIEKNKNELSAELENLKAEKKSLEESISLKVSNLEGIPDDLSQLLAKKKTIEDDLKMLEEGYELKLKNLKGLEIEEEKIEIRVANLIKERKSLNTELEYSEPQEISNDDARIESKQSELDELEKKIKEATKLYGEKEKDLEKIEIKIGKKEKELEGGNFSPSKQSHTEFGISNEFNKDSDSIKLSATKENWFERIKGKYLSLKNILMGLGFVVLLLSIIPIYNEIFNPEDKDDKNTSIPKHTTYPQGDQPSEEEADKVEVIDEPRTNEKQNSSINSNKKLEEIKVYIERVEKQDNSYEGEEIEEYYIWLKTNHPENKLFKRVKKVYLNWSNSGYAFYKLKQVNKKFHEDTFAEFVQNVLEEEGLSEKNVKNIDSYIKFIQKYNDLIDLKKVSKGTEVIFFLPKDEFKKEFQ